MKCLKQGIDNGCKDEAKVSVMVKVSSFYFCLLGKVIIVCVYGLLYALAVVESFVET